MQSNFCYYAASYARASKDDADSSTIENQKELIRDYVKELPKNEGFPEVRIVSEREDNGFSGATFFRPSFGEMMKDIESGKINCVIVKDLSRLGRNYIEVGELIDLIFPRYNVRLIAINDNYDSLNPRNDADDIIIPFKNLINEHYLRDFSIKIRSNLNVKRKNGDFVAPLAPYGYMRDADDKRRLVVDEQAAGVVRDIFRWKIEGRSQQKIADRLNEIGEPSPAEYKRRDGKFFTAFQKNARALWSAVTVGRILKNPMYIGTLVQGKRTTPNYKVKKEIIKPEEEWNVIPDAHEPIINKCDFETVISLLRQDTRTAPQKESVFPLAGLVFCADCGNSMVRKKSGNYYYYVCGTSKAGKGCSSHCNRQNMLENAVLETVRQQIIFALDIDRSLEYARTLQQRQRDVLKLNAHIADREKEIKSCEKYKMSLYEDYKNGIITKEDYIGFGEDYTDRISVLKQAAAGLRREAELFLENNSSSHKWIEYFMFYRSVPELSRELAVNLIERIDVYEGKRVSIKLRYRDRLAAEALSLLAKEGGK